MTLAGGDGGSVHDGCGLDIMGFWEEGAAGPRREICWTSRGIFLNFFINMSALSAPRHVFGKTWAGSGLSVQVPCRFARRHGADQVIPFEGRRSGVLTRF